MDRHNALLDQTRWHFLADCGIGGVVGSLGGWAGPEVPLQGLGYRRSVGRPFASGPRLAAPDVDLAHRADRSRPDQLENAPVVLAGVDLSAHPGCGLGPGRRLGEMPGSEQVVGQGFSQWTGVSRARAIDAAKA